jgi:toxin ParE1/3/4
MDRFYAAFARLAEFPQTGSPRPQYAALGGDVRAWVLHSYLIIYEVREGRIEILRVLHGVRDIERLVEQGPGGRG